MQILNSGILESVMIGDEVSISILAIDGNQVCFAIQEPISATIYRKDIIKKFTVDSPHYRFHENPNIQNANSSEIETKIAGNF